MKSVRINVNVSDTSWYGCIISQGWSSCATVKVWNHKMEDS